MSEVGRFDSFRSSRHQLLAGGFGGRDKVGGTSTSSALLLGSGITFSGSAGTGRGLWVWNVGSHVVGES